MGGSRGANANLADLVRAAATRRPDGAAMVHVPPHGGRSTLTWSALHADVEAAAAGLRAGLDLHAGQRVALAMANTPAFVTAYFGVLRAGLVAVPLDTASTAPETARLLDEAGAKVVLCDDTTLTVVEEAVAGTRRALVDPAGLESVTAAGRGASLTPSDRGGEDLAVLMFTSGTSGRPRAAMLSHRALLANLDQCLALQPTPMTEDDVVLLVLPLSHVYGLNTGLGMVAATAATGVLAERFDPVGTSALVRAERVTSVLGTPPMYVAWAASESVELLRGVRMLVSGASPVPPAVLEQVQTAVGVTIREGYGRTETAPVVTSTLASGMEKPGSIGRPVPGVEVKLVDDSGAEAVEDDPGELWVRGANLFSGYWPDGSGGPDPEGWWATGDVAYADDDGDLFLVLAEHPDVAEVAETTAPLHRRGTEGRDVSARVTLIGKPGCHLCDEARQVVARVTADLGEEFEELSILDDPELAERYWEQIPVTLVDGAPHDFWRVSESRLRAALGA